MLDASKLKTDILSDMRVELSDEFDRNFERKAFFSEKWTPRAHQYQRGSLLSVTSALRRSTQGQIQGNGVRFFSSLPYATAHNDGAQIKVTPKMKRFFWAKFMETKQQSWKYMALMPVGKVIIIPQRKFIGDGPEVERIIREVIDDNLQRFNLSLVELLKP